MAFGGVQIAVGNYTWLNSYALTKYFIERAALMYNKEHGTKIAVVRGLNVYGPHQKHAPIRKVVPTFIVNALRGDDLEVYGDGAQILDLIHVDDMVRVLAAAALHSGVKFDKTYDAGLGTGITVTQIAEAIIYRTNSPSHIVFVPMRPGEPEHSTTKAENVRALFDMDIDYWKFQSPGNGLKSTVEWYRENYPWRVEDAVKSVR